MNTLKLRRILIQIHLYLAGFLGPVFLLVAITGGMDLIGWDAKTSVTEINLPANTQLDYKSETIEDDIAKVLADNNIDISFDYVRVRGAAALTRPTSRNYARFEKTPNGLKLELHEPNLQYSLMELHKGHGPQIFRFFQIFAAIALFLVVIGGMAVGLLAKAYRKATLLSTIVGALAFIVLAFF